MGCMKLSLRHYFIDTLADLNPLYNKKSFHNVGVDSSYSFHQIQHPIDQDRVNKHLKVPIQKIYTVF